jgi:hypothetical protein
MAVSVGRPGRVSLVDGAENGKYSDTGGEGHSVYSCAGRLSSIDFGIPRSRERIRSMHSAIRDRFCGVADR